MITCKCLHCGKEFKTHQCYIKRGGGKFCSQSCNRTHKNLISNPAKNADTRRKISKNHADVSGVNNPMYGMKGILAPNFIDGRSNFKGRTSRKIALANFEHKCFLCGEDDLGRLHAHHKDMNRENNELRNLVFLCSTCHLKIAHTYLRDEAGKFVKITVNDIFERGDAI